MHDNQLVLHRDVDASKYAYFAKERDEFIPEISNEELQAEEQMEREQKMSQMFFGDMGGSSADIYEMHRHTLEEIQKEVPVVVLEVEELKAETKDPFHDENYQIASTVFARTMSTTAKTMDEFMAGGDYTPLSPASGSRSTDYVVGSGGLGTRPSVRDNLHDPVRPSNPSYAGTSTTSGSTAQPAKPRHIFDDMGEISKKIQTLAVTSSKWNDEKREKSWGKKGWWRRTKEFLGGKKGRIMIKFGALLALQLGMAVIGKKYSFDNLWQASGFLCMMLGTFFITKELHAEGFDPRGVGIL
jgi:hypothetical protein